MCVCGLLVPKLAFFACSSHTLGGEKNSVPFIGSTFRFHANYFQIYSDYNRLTSDSQATRKRLIGNHLHIVEQASRGQCVKRKVILVKIGSKETKTDGSTETRGYKNRDRAETDGV